VRIIITGSEGFIGSSLLKELRNVGHLVTGMDILLGANNDASSQRDVRNLIEATNAEMIVHLAGKSEASFLPEDDAMQTVRENAGMSAVIAQACGEYGIRLVLGSTDEVYGDNGKTVCEEFDGPWSHPRTLYGLTKLWSEQVGKLYAPEGFTTLRYSMVYGPGIPAGPRRPAIVNMLWRAKSGHPIPVHADAERSWCWINDAIKATRFAIEDGEGPYNIGRDDDLQKMFVVAENACSITGAEKEMIEIIEPPNRNSLSKRVSAYRLRRLGWKPEKRLWDGMSELYEAWVQYLDENGRYIDPEEVVEEVEEEIVST